MVKFHNEKKQSEIITIGSMSLPTKVLASSIIFVMSFGLVFGYVSLRALWEMWFKLRSRES